MTESLRYHPVSGRIAGWGSNGMSEVSPVKGVKGVKGVIIKESGET